MLNRKKCKNCCNIRLRRSMLIAENFICLHTMHFVGLRDTCKYFNKITDNVIKNLGMQKKRRAK